MDSEVLQYVNAASAFWSQKGVEVGQIDVEPVSADIPCAGGVAPDDAMFCHHKTGGGTVKYKPARFSQMESDGGDLAVKLTVVHEMGHAVQRALDSVPKDRDRKELSADCFAGAYLASTGAEIMDTNTAIAHTQLVNIPGAADAVGYGIASYASQERGGKLVNSCLNYKPFR